MNPTFRLLLLFLLSTVISKLIYAQKTDGIKMPMIEKHWTVTAGNVKFIDYKSTQAVKSVDDKFFNIALNDLQFSEGTIEFDVEISGNGFPGISFRLDPEALNAERFYLRHFGKPDPLRRTTMQYAAIIDGVNLWDITDDYQAGTTLYEDQWNHIKLVISKNQLKAYVNDMEHPALHVPALEGISKTGGIALSGNVIFANMVIRPNKSEDLPSVSGYDPTANDPRYLRNWEMTEPIDFPFGRDVLIGIPSNPRVAIDTNLLDSTAIWKSINADRRALINLTKIYGATDRGQRRLIWLKTTIHSESDQEKLLRLGFSDEVWVFINKQPLHIDKNYYGSPGMKDPIGRCTLDNTSFNLPLQEGGNEILIGLTNYFFGWGFIARLEETEGLRY